MYTRSLLALAFLVEVSSAKVYPSKSIDSYLGLLACISEEIDSVKALYINAGENPGLSFAVFYDGSSYFVLADGASMNISVILDGKKIEAENVFSPVVVKVRTKVLHGKRVQDSENETVDFNLVYQISNTIKFDELVFVDKEDNPSIIYRVKVDEKGLTISKTQDAEIERKFSHKRSSHSR